MSLFGLITVGWLIALLWLAATLDTRKNGFFIQARVGRNGDLFNAIKIRTMKDISGFETVVTTRQDPRITPLGHIVRRLKLDELPQLINVFLGHMSFVGPRPDVPGYADLLQGDDRIVLTVRPGITGPATIRFRHEERELAEQLDPERYNREVIYPLKVKLNREYIEKYTFQKDLRYIYRTIIPAGSSAS